MKKNALSSSMAAGGGGNSVSDNQGAAHKSQQGY